MYRFGHWTHSQTHPSDARLTSQRISEFFSQTSFYGVVHSWLSNTLLMASSNIWFSITSISSYSELLRQIRYREDQQPRAPCTFVLGSRRNTRFVYGHIDENRKPLCDFINFDADLGYYVATAVDILAYNEYDNVGRPFKQARRRIDVHMYHNSAHLEVDKSSFFAQLSQTTQAFTNVGCQSQQQAIAEEIL